MTAACAQTIKTCHMSSGIQANRNIINNYSNSGMQQWVRIVNLKKTKLEPVVNKNNGIGRTKTRTHNINKIMRIGNEKVM